MQYARHGDLLFTKIDKAPKGRKLNTLTVAKGEHTNHSHRFTEGSKVALIESDGVMFAEILENSDLIHEEHKKITFEPGVYKITHEREYDYFLKEVRKVVD